MFSSLTHNWKFRKNQLEFPLWNWTVRRAGNFFQFAETTKTNSILDTEKPIKQRGKPNKRQTRGTPTNKQLKDNKETQKANLTKLNKNSRNPKPHGSRTVSTWVVLKKSLSLFFGFPMLLFFWSSVVFFNFFGFLAV